MYKFIVLLIFIISPNLIILSQESKQKEKLDIVRLKNGKTVKGIVLKRELGVISIKVADSISRNEKVLHYQQNDIERIILGESVQNKNNKTSDVESAKNIPLTTKKTKQSNTPATDTPFELLPEKNQDQAILKPVPLPDNKTVNKPVIMPVAPVNEGEMLAAPIDPSELKKPLRSRVKHRGWYRQIRGYRGFIEYGYIVGMGHTKNNKMEFLTSHGFQFNPIFYIGLGAGGYLSLNDKDHSLPVFVNGRMNFLDEYTTPFIDIKTGYSVAEGKGFYFNASAGVSFTKKGRHALNLSVTYCAQNVKYYEWQNTSPITRIAIRERQRGLGLRLGLEF